MADLVITSDPAITVSQDTPAVTAVVPVSSAPQMPLSGIAVSAPLSQSVDFNGVTSPGLWHAVDTLSANAPVNGLLWYLSVEVYSAAPGYCIQVATELAAVSQISYIRTQVNGTWNAWQQTVALNSSGVLPAVDGSQLINLPPSYGGCGKLKFVSTTQISLVPFKGEQIVINGQLCTIPAAGITGGVGGLTNGTLYFVYATSASGAVNALVFSTNAHATSATAGNVGTEIMNGDDTKSLVGMVWLAPGPVFEDGASLHLVRSWFNDSGTVSMSSNNSATTTSGGTFGNIDGTVAAGGLYWSSEQISISFTASAANSVGGDYCLISISQSANGGSATLLTAEVVTECPTANLSMGMSVTTGLISSNDQFLEFFPMGAVNAGTGTFTFKVLCSTSVRR